MPPVVDQTLLLAIEGYGWLPNRRRRAPGPLVHARLMGQRVVGMCGPEAARFFYDEANIRRHTAVPEPVRGTLFGKGAVHTLDGEAHRVRKAMFMALMTAERVEDLVARATAAWDEAVRRWADGRPVVLFDEASRVITEAVCGWAGVPLVADEVEPVAADLVALVDGFATLGTRHWRARRARGRLEDRLAGLVTAVRAGAVEAPAGSALRAVATHADADGADLPPRVAAVELLNVVRPTVAVCWFVAFAAHALHRWPELREPLRAGEQGYVASFVQELRRFYPFAPFVGGRAVRDASWRGEQIPAGALVLLDLYGADHDPALWPQPYAFKPDRFAGREIGDFDLVPQGAGSPSAGHRCPGEGITVALLRALCVRLAALDYDVPEQDLTISLARIPTRPASGFVLRLSRSPGRVAGAWDGLSASADLSRR